MSKTQPVTRTKQTPKTTTINISNIEQLNHLCKDELQQLFRQHFPRMTIPQVKQLIIAEIAYHIQSQQLGSTDKATQDRLNIHKQQYLKDSTKKLSSSIMQQQITKEAQPTQTIKHQPRISNQLADGTVLKRQFNGRVYEVLVRVGNSHKDNTTHQPKTCFIFQSKTYRSLSKIAEEITGSHWSGPRFFGLTKIKPSTQSRQEVKEP